jgi:ribosome-associated heat shock protein Hsp15
MDPSSTSTTCAGCGHRKSDTGRCSIMDVMESTRVDRWLWAVRLTKTRPDAATACKGGHVRVNDRPAKASTAVSPGDEVRALVGDTTRIVEVVRVIQKRVGAADAVTCYLDRTPPPPLASVVPVAARDRGAGRPTKRDRRILDKWRAGRV